MSKHFTNHIPTGQVARLAPAMWSVNLDIIAGQAPKLTDPLFPMTQGCRLLRPRKGVARKAQGSSESAEKTSERFLTLSLFQGSKH